MAVLPDADRFDVWAEYMRVEGTPHSIVKAQLREVVNALDQFLSDNAAAINNAIPQPQRSSLTASQKARILALVILKRYVKGA